MAKRQDSDSDSAQQDQRPTPRNEDALPEMNDETRGLASEADDEDDFDDDEDVDDEENEESDEGTF